MRRAEQESWLRYGAEVRGLREILDSATSDYERGLRAEKSAAAGLRKAIDQAGPEIAAAYADAGLTVQNAQADVQLALGDRAGQSAALRESAMAKSRLGAALADVKSELANRKVDAEQARTYGVQQLRGEYRADKQKVEASKRDLEQEIGIYAASTFADMVDARAKLNLEKRKVRVDIADNQEQRRANREDEGLARDRLSEDQRHNREVEGESDGKKGGKKYDRGTISRHQTLMERIEEAASTARTVLGKGATPEKAVKMLSTGKKVTDADGVTMDNPYGGYSSYMARVGVALAHKSIIPRHLLGGLYRQGLVPDLTPLEWRRRVLNRRSPAGGPAEDPYQGRPIRG